MNHLSLLLRKWDIIINGEKLHLFHAYNMNSKGTKTFLTNWTLHTTYLLIHKLEIHSVTLSKEILLVSVSFSNRFPFSFLSPKLPKEKRKKLTFLKGNHKDHKGVHIHLELSCFSAFQIELKFLIEMIFS